MTSSARTFVQPQPSGPSTWRAKSAWVNGSPSTSSPIIRLRLVLPTMNRMCGEVARSRAFGRECGLPPATRRRRESRGDSARSRPQNRRCDAARRRSFAASCHCRIGRKLAGPYGRFQTAGARDQVTATRRIVFADATSPFRRVLDRLFMAGSVSTRPRREAAPRARPATAPICGKHRDLSRVHCCQPST